MTRADGKRDRDEMFVEYTKSICPVCKVVVDAQVNICHDKVYLRKRCREHGSFEALVYGDAQMYLESARFNKPGTFPLRFQTEVRDGCPSDCGLCPDHKQHACLGLIEVNTHCNLDCPICFADSGHQPDGYAITAAQCERMLDTLVAAEGEPEVAMFSGGEPTIHKQLLEFVDAAQARPVKTVIINTNGIRLASDRRFVDQLATRNRPGHPVHIYLQFDGLDEATHRRIRGHDLRDVKQRALDNCAAAGLTVSLVAAVERGLNEHELGAVIRHGMAQPGVQPVVFQPVTHAGRHVQFDPLTRLTNSDIIACITAQLPEWFRPGDFFPVPCCFPSCRSITYLLTDGEHVVPIPRLLNVEDYLDYVSNRVIPDLAIREALENLWSASAVPGTDTMTAQLQRATAALNCAEGCGINLPEALTHLTDRVFAIVIQDFQDPYTLNVKQLMKCCVQQITPDGRLIPFCAYNSVGYREQVREQLTGVPVPDIVPNAIPLAGLLADAPHGSKQANTGGSIARLAGPTRGAPMALGPVGVAARTAATVGDALAIFNTFMAAYSPVIAIRITPLAGQRSFIALEFLLDEPASYPQTMELALGVALGVIRLLLGADYAPLAVHLPHDPLTPEAFYLQYFGCRPYFAERVGGFTMRTADLSRPLNRDDVAHRVVVDYLSSITPLGEGIVESVRTIVRQLLPTGAATLNVVAEQFHLHPKTLQRRLAEENTTFVILVDRVRKDVADRYLRTTGIGLTHLARELGYAEQSVLTRSCKRWFGTGPAAYRNQARLQTTVSAPGSGRGPNPGNVSVSC